MASNILEPSMLILATEFIFLILLLNTKIIIKHILYLTTDDISLKDNIVKKNLLVAREGIFNWLYKGNSSGINKLLDKVSISLIKGSLEAGYINRANKQFNLRMALKDYFEGGKEMASMMKEIKEKYPANRVEIDVKQDIKKYIEELNLEIETETNNNYIIKISDEEKAHKLLNKLVADGINIDKFEIKKPTLNDIFIEKVGE